MVILFGMWVLLREFVLTRKFGLLDRIAIWVGVAWKIGLLDRIAIWIGVSWKIGL